VAFEQLQSFMSERASTAALSAIPTVSAFGAGIERVQNPHASNTMMPPVGIFNEDPTQLPPYMRGFYTALQKAKARHPMFSDGLPPSLNLWGEVRMQGKGVGYELWSPVRISEAKYRGLDKELMNLGDGLSMPSRKINGVLLNAEQYNFMIRRMNEPVAGEPRLLDALNELIYSTDYGLLVTKEDKLAAIRATAEPYYAAGRKLLMAEDPSLADRINAAR